MEASTSGPAMDASTLRISDRGDLIAAVPYLLGFHPQHSLVILVLHGKRLVVTARIDLPEPEDFVHVPGFVTKMINANGGDAAVIIAFVDDSDHPTEWLFALCCDVLPREQVRDALVVTDGRWFSVFDDAAAVCDDATPSVVAAVMHGMVALPSRSDVGRLALPSVQEDTTAFAAVLLRLAGEHPGDADRHERMDRLLDAIATECSGPGSSDRSEEGFEPSLAGADPWIELALLAGTAAGRAAALARLDRDAAPAAVALWSAVVRRTPAEWAVGALCLLGTAAWVDGDGALQLICAERAQVLDPSDGLAADLLELNCAMVPPSAWDPSLVGRRQTRLPPQLFGPRFGEAAGSG
ncbi:DUF4192 domain-containing protein [Naumannella halotolerans]|nr:DUF4192 domain-containing protein [Naumannella halotolerans]